MVISGIISGYTTKNEDKMKKSFLLIFLLITFGCNNKSTNPKELLFSVNNFDKLELESISELWKWEDIRVDDIDRFLDYNEGFQGGKELGSDNSLLFIYVFKSKGIALQLTEEYLLSISMYTEESSDHTVIKERWWRTPYSNRTIFVNKLNTVISLTHRLEVDSNFTKYVALEIMNRIEHNSD